MHIAPTVGRVVHYRVSSHEAAYGMELYDLTNPMTALVTFVWSDTCVNLAVFDHAGRSHMRTSVPINVTHGASAWAEWMPYQQGQAAKTEALQSEVAAFARKEPTPLA